MKRLHIRKVITYSLQLIAILLVFSFLSCSKKEKVSLTEETQDTSGQILYYTCGMHPQIRVSVEEYNKGKTKGPICGMDLVPVYKEKAVKKSTGARKNSLLSQPYESRNYLSCAQEGFHGYGLYPCI